MPVIVSPATSALMIASSVASTVASNTAPIRSFEIIDTCAASFLAAAPAFAVENAMKMSPDPLLETRSEEHTSELQSRVDLVCRLLLEKKNTTKKYKIRHK